MMDSDWIEYNCKSGKTVFLYNKVTGEHKWPPGSDDGQPEDSSMYGQPVEYKVLISISTQTDDYGCDNGCSSMYIKTHVTNITETLPELQPVVIVDYGDENTTVEKIGYESLDNNADPHHVTNVTETLPQPQPVVIVDDGDEKTTVEKIHYQSLDNNADPHHVTNITETLVQPLTGRIKVDGRDLHVDVQHDTEIERDKQCQSIDVNDSDQSSLQDNFFIYKHGKQSQEKDAISSDTGFPDKTGVKIKDEPEDCSVEYQEQTSKDYDEIFSLASILDKNDFLQENTLIQTNEQTFVNDCENIQSQQCEGEETSLVCPTCAKQFRNNLTLTKHLRRHQTPLFECWYCKERFSQKVSFVYHLTTHTNAQKFFDCLFCDENFHRKVDLVAHLEMHDEIQQNYKNGIKVTYEIQEQGTMRKRPKLIDSIGYTYNIQGKTARATYWQCTVRPTGHRCNASVVQRDGKFVAGLSQHNHSVRRKTIKNSVMRRKKMKKHIPTDKPDVPSVNSKADAHAANSISELLPQTQPGFAANDDHEDIQHHEEKLQESEEECQNMDVIVETQQTLQRGLQENDDTKEQDGKIEISTTTNSSITYTVEEEGTLRKKPKLIDSTGYTYNIKYKTQTQTYWQCTVRPTGNQCSAFVVEKRGEFIAGPKQHNHCVRVRAIKRKNQIKNDRRRKSTY